MDRARDYGKFAGILKMVSEATAGGKITPDKVEIYFRGLQDMDLPTIEERMVDHIRRNKWFPSVAEVRQEDERMIEIQAQEDYGILEELVDQFLFPGFPEAGMNIIRDKLTTMGRSHLISAAGRWGAEIALAENRTATRAQFLAAHRAEIVRQRLIGEPRPVPAQLGGPVKELVESLAEKMNAK